MTMHAKRSFRELKLLRHMNQENVCLCINIISAHVQYILFNSKNSFLEYIWDLEDLCICIVVKGVVRRGGQGGGAQGRLNFFFTYPSLSVSSPCPVAVLSFYKHEKFNVSFTDSVAFGTTVVSMEQLGM